MGIEKALMKMGEGALDSLDDAAFYKLLKENMPDKAIQQYGGHKGVREVLKRGNNPLMLLHRLSPESLAKTKGYHGAEGKSIFVNPSLQAMDPMKNDGGDYGDIILFGTKDMLYPSKKRYAAYEGEPDFYEKPRLYSADLWSPRIPREEQRKGGKYIEGTNQLFTPENVSKYMNKQGTRAALTDGGWVTAGSYKGANAVQYKNLNEADKSALTQILPWKEYDQKLSSWHSDLFNRINDLLWEENLSPAQYEGIGMKPLVDENDVLKVLQEKKLHPRKKRDEDDLLDFLDLPEYAPAIKDIEKMTAATPTGYFEGKVDRPVQLGEFSKALIPARYQSAYNSPDEDRTSEEKMYAEVIDTLKEAGIPYGTYENSPSYGGLNGLQKALVGEAEGKDRFTTDYLLNARPEAPEIEREGALLNRLLAKKPADNQPSLFDYDPGEQSNAPAVPATQAPSAPEGGQISIFDQPPTTPATPEQPAIPASTPETPPEDPMKYLEEARKMGGKIVPEPVEETPAVKPEDEIMVEYGVKGEGRKTTSLSEMIDVFDMRAGWDSMSEAQKQEIIERLKYGPKAENGAYRGLFVFDDIDKADKKVRLKRGKEVFASPEAREFREQLGTNLLTEPRASIRGAAGTHSFLRDTASGLPMKGSEKIQMNLRSAENIHRLNSVQLHESQHAAWARIPMRNKKLILKDLFNKSGINIELSNKIVESVDANELMSYAFQARYGTEYMKDYEFKVVQEHLDRISRMAKTDKISFREKIVNAIIALVDYMKMKIKYGARFVTSFDDYYNSLLHGGFKEDFAKDITQFSPAHGMTTDEVAAGFVNGIEMARKIDAKKRKAGIESGGLDRIRDILERLERNPVSYPESRFGLTPAQAQYARFTNELKRLPQYTDEEKNMILDAMDYESYANDVDSHMLKTQQIAPQPRKKNGRWTSPADDALSFDGLLTDDGQIDLDEALHQLRFASKNGEMPPSATTEDGRAIGFHVTPNDFKANDLRANGGYVSFADSIPASLRYVGNPLGAKQAISTTFPQDSIMDVTEAELRQLEESSAMRSALINKMKRSHKIAIRAPQHDGGQEIRVPEEFLGKLRKKSHKIKNWQS